MLVHCLITPNPPTHDVFTQRMGVYSAQMRDVVTAATFLCQKTLLSQTFSPIRRNKSLPRGFAWRLRRHSYILLSEIILPILKVHFMCVNSLILPVAIEKCGINNHQIDWNRNMYYHVSSFADSHCFLVSRPQSSCQHRARMMSAFTQHWSRCL